MKIDPNVVLALATVVLVIVTFYHMMHAKELVNRIDHIIKIMMEQNARAIAPYPEVRCISGDYMYDGTHAVVVIPLRIYNFGSYMFRIRNVQSICTVQKYPGKKEIRTHRDLDERIVNPNGGFIQFQGEFAFRELKGVVELSLFDFDVEMDVAGIDGIYKKGIYKARVY